MMWLNRDSDSKKRVRFINRQIITLKVVLLLLSYLFAHTASQEKMSKLKSKLGCYADFLQITKPDSNIPHNPDYLVTTQVYVPHV